MFADRRSSGVSPTKTNVRDMVHLALTSFESADVEVLPRSPRRTSKVRCEYRRLFGNEQRRPNRVARSSAFQLKSANSPTPPFELILDEAATLRRALTDRFPDIFAVDRCRHDQIQNEYVRPRRPDRTRSPTRCQV